MERSCTSVFQNILSRIFLCYELEDDFAEDEDVFSGIDYNHVMSSNIRRSPALSLSDINKNSRKSFHEAVRTSNRRSSCPTPVKSEDNSEKRHSTFEISSIFQPHPSKQLSDSDRNILKNLKIILKNGISVKRHKLRSEPQNIILGCTSDLSSLTINYYSSHGLSLENGKNKSKKSSPPLNSAIHILAGTDPDPSSPNLSGTLALRRAGVANSHAMAIIWPNNSLNIEFNSPNRCFEFLKHIRLLKSVLGWSNSSEIIGTF